MRGSPDYHAAMTVAALENRIRFVNVLARRLHEYGTSAPRLEAAIDKVANRLGMSCHSLSTPTSIILSYGKLEQDEDAIAKHTQVIRLDPGIVDLKRLAQVDAIAERVYHDQIDIDEGYRLLREVEDRPRLLIQRFTPIAYGLSSGSVATLLQTGWTDVLAAAAIGTLIGTLALRSERNRHFSAGFEAIAAMIAGGIACLVHAYLVPLSINAVLISALIVLFPGLTLTTAVNELAAKHLVSGVARLAGAVAVLLKLAFGAVVAMQLARAYGLPLQTRAVAPVPMWTEWLALLGGSFAFAVLFRAARRDYVLVMASACLGYLSTRLGGELGGAEFGVFFGGLVVSSAANLFGRLKNRPGALVRVPGIILLVPGSVGFRSVFMVFEHDIFSGLGTAVSMLVLLVYLVAGLLFGNVLVPPRRSLS